MFLRLGHPLFEKLERLLTHWIDSHNERSAALSFMIIQHKALSLFENSRRRQLKRETRVQKNWNSRGVTDGSRDSRSVPIFIALG
jgi:hypothetical protein